MLIIIDTTETYKDLLLRGPDWVVLQHFVRHRAKTVVVIPQVVLEETRNHYRKRLLEAQRLFEASVGEMKELIDGLSYDAHLTKRLTALATHEAPYADLDVQSLIGRSLEERHPFSGDGQRGFRDAVLWNSILPLISSCDKVVLITNDAKAFGKPDELPSALAHDVARAGLEASQFMVCKSLHEFVEANVIPVLKRLDTLAKEIAEDKSELFSIRGFCADSYDLIQGRVAEFVRDYALRQVTAAMGRAYSLVEMDDLATEPHDWQVLGVHSLDDDTVVLDLRYMLHGRLQISEAIVKNPEWAQVYYGEVEYVVELSAIMEHATGQIEEVGIERVSMVIPLEEWRLDDSN